MSGSSQQGVRYKSYEATDFAAVRDLFKLVWGANRSVEYDAKHWNETLIGLCPAIVGIWEEQIVGFYMVWPIPLSDGQQQILGGQPIDSMVHPKFQGKGMLRELACRCYELCNERTIGVMFGAPNRAAYSGNVGALNWCHVRNIFDLARPLATLPRRRPRWAEHEGRWTHDNGAAASLAAAAHKNFPSELAALWEEVAPIRRSWQVRQTRAWMDYRYRSVPDAEYYTLALPGDGGHRAAAICGLRKVGSRTKATLAEVIAGDENSRHEIVAAVASWAKFRGAQVLFAKSTLTNPGDRLYRQGFVPFRRTPLISRTLTAKCFAANAFSSSAWVLFGGAFDTV